MEQTNKNLNGKQIVYFPINLCRVSNHYRVNSPKSIHSLTPRSQIVNLPIVVNLHPSRYGVVVEGTDRVTALAAMGLTHIPAIFCCCTEQHEREHYYLLTS